MEHGKGNRLFVSINKYLKTKEKIFYSRNLQLCYHLFTFIQIIYFNLKLVYFMLNC